MRLFFYILAFFLTFHVHSKSMVWKVEKNGTVAYLGGTIHVLRNIDYPLPKEFEWAYQHSDLLVFETDIGQMKEPAFGMKMLLDLSYKDDRTVKSVTSKEIYDQLNDYATKNGFSLEFMRKAKPGLLMSQMAMLELAKIGANSPGVDMHFFKKAKKDNKPIIYYETPNQQIDFMGKIGEGNENNFYKAMLSEVEQSGPVFLQMLHHWRTGNEDELDEVATQPMKQQTPKMYEILLVKRNNNWMPHIEAQLKTPEVEFILVGAAHLTGKDGLLTQLESAGYKTTQLDRANPH